MKCICSLTEYPENHYNDPMAVKSTGNCYLCSASLGKTAMKNHLSRLHTEEAEQECCLLKIEGFGKKNYWLYADVPVDRTLTVVDAFLRRIWLECCGHLSEFYVCTSAERFGFSGRQKMSSGIKLGDFKKGDTFFHMYDFGSTTETDITVIGRTWRKSQRSIVRLLARNAPPVFECAECGKPASYVCIPYMEPIGNIYRCWKCTGDKDDDGEYVMHPISNSPRMGVCGYDGELDTFEFQSWKIK